MPRPIPDDAREITRLVAHRVYRNGFISLFDDEVTFPDGSPGTYLRLVAGDGSPGVAILVTCEDLVALVLTYRYPVGLWEWGIPRGMASDRDPRATAFTELKEELGGEPVSLEPVGVVHPDSGLLATKVQVFHAEWSRPVAEPDDSREVQGVAWVSWDELDDLVRRGELNDSFTLSALALARVHGIDQRGAAG